MTEGEQFMLAWKKMQMQLLQKSLDHALAVGNTQFMFGGNVLSIHYAQDLLDMLSTKDAAVKE